MGPDEALRRIAYLLEAQGAPTYKVQAFRRAASTVDDLAPAELARLDEHGRLETLPGVGKSTATVISEALSGSVPKYLQALEENVPVLPPGPVRSLFESLRGDCHSHSDWSDGGSTIFEMACTARDLGHDYLALTDHSPRLTVAHGLSADDLRRQLEVAAGVNEDLAPFRLLTGIEVDILDDGALDQEEAAAQPARRRGGERPFGPAHGAAGDDQAPGGGRGEPPRGHPRPLHGPAPGGPGPPTVELRPGPCSARARPAAPPSRSTPGPSAETRPKFLKAAAAAGCRFAIDTDAHAPGQLSWLTLGCEQAVAAGIPASSIVNTLPLDDFLGPRPGARPPSPGPVA